MKSWTKIFAILFGIFFLVSSAVHAQSVAYYPFRQILWRKRFSKIIGQDQDVFKVFDNWLTPFKEQGKRSFSDIRFEDENVVIPLMKKGRPRGPPRFGKRSVNPSQFIPILVHRPFRDQLYLDIDNFQV